jgi:hypothetical protein
MTLKELKKQLDFILKHKYATGNESVILFYEGKEGMLVQIGRAHV